MATEPIQAGDLVLYESTTGKLLGPFEVWEVDDEGPDIWIPAGGNHVHGIIGDRIVTIGWPEAGKLDAARFQRTGLTFKLPD